MYLYVRICMMKISLILAVMILLVRAAGATTTIITEGGTYTGQTFVGDGTSPAVNIATTAPVTLTNCIIVSSGSGIVTIPGVNLTVQSCIGSIITDEGTRGIFLRADTPAFLSVSYCTISGGTNGIWVQSPENAATTKAPISIVRNTFRQIHASSIILQFQRNDPSIYIAGNYIINQPGQAEPTDQIDIYGSSGTPAHPILVVRNFIQGVWTKTYAAGIVTDYATNDPTMATHDVAIRLNYLIDCSWSGLQLSSGLNNAAWENTILSDGTIFNQYTFGAGNIDYNMPGLNWQATNKVYGNLVAVIDPTTGQRHDFQYGAVSLQLPHQYTPDPNETATLSAQNTSLPDSALAQGYQARAYQEWFNTVRGK